MRLSTHILPCALALAVTAVSVPAQTAAQPAANPYAIVSPPPVRAEHAMVVSIHHDASDAGVEILKHGGNAVDAAVAVGFALAVVYPAAGNIGGGGFMLIRTHTGPNQVQTHFLDYREMAPSAATANMYLDAHGNIIPGASITGYQASGVPGTVAGLCYAQKHFGKLSLAADMAPAIRLATDGFVLSADEARALHAAPLTRFPASAEIFQRNGNFYAAGDTFKQPLLAATLRTIARDPADFYKGDIARQIAAFEQANGGLITAADLAAYQVKEREPLTGSYRGYTILTAPPPSSGGIVLVEILNIPLRLQPAHARRRPPRSPRGRSTSSRSKPSSSFSSPRLHGPQADYLPATPTSSPCPSSRWLRPQIRRRLAQDHRRHPRHAQQGDPSAPPASCPRHPAVPPAQGRVAPDLHALLHVVDPEGNGHLQHLHPQLRLRSPASPSAAARLPAQRRDGRDFTSGPVPQRLRPHPERQQRHRPRQAPALPP